MSRAEISRQAIALLASVGLQTTDNIKWPKGSLEFWLSEKARAQAAIAPVEQKAEAPASVAPAAADVHELRVVIRDVVPLSEEALAKSLVEGRRPRHSVEVATPVEVVAQAPAPIAEVVAQAPAPIAEVVAPVEAPVIVVAQAPAPIAEVVAPVEAPVIPPRAPPPRIARVAPPQLRKEVRIVPTEQRAFRIPDLHDVLNTTGRPLLSEYYDAIMFKRGLYLVSERAIECIPYPADITTAPMLDRASPNDILANVAHSHGLRFKSPRPILIAYDIETYHSDPNDHSVPEPGDTSGSRLGMISTDALLPSGKREQQVFLVNPSFQHPTFAGVHEFPTEQAAIMSFIHYVRTMSQSRPVVLHGYHSSCTWKAKYDWKVVGYDLPFILLRSGLPHESIEAELSGCKALQASSHGTESARQTDLVNIFGLRVHLLDTMAIVSACSRIDEKMGSIGHPDGGKLGHMLAAYGLPLKHEVPPSAIGPILRDRAVVDGLGIEQVIKYCVRDSEACNDLLAKVSWLDRTLAFADLLQVPLSMAIHKTQPACLMFSLAGTIRGAGMPTTYATPSAIIEALEKAPSDGARAAIMRSLHLAEVPPPTRPKFRGGFNLTRPAAILSTKTSIMLDFQSLYPSVMLAFHISPFTYLRTTINEPEAIEGVASGRAYAIENDPPQTIAEEQVHLGDRQLSPDGKTKSWLLFARESELNPFLRCLNDYFQLRLRYKRDLVEAKAAGDKSRAAFADSMQYAVKIAINTLYGLTGSPRSCYYYKYECAAAVCLAARIVINTAMKVMRRLGTILYSDTDSACLEPADGLLPNPREHPAEYRAARDALVDRINVETRAELPACDRERFNFVFEKTFTAAIFPVKKKSYAYLKIKGDPRTSEEYAEVFDSSGFQFSQLSGQVKTRTLRVAEMWMRAPSTETRKALLSDFFTSELVSIKRDPRPYAKLLKVSNSICASIARRNPAVQFTEKSTHVLPVNSGERLKTDRWALAASAADVQSDEVLRYCYLSNLSRLIPEVREIIASCIGLTPRERARVRATAATPANDASEEGRILVREERLAAGGGIVNIAPEPYKLSALLEALSANGSERAYHEILPDMHRMVFDIDAPADGVFSIGSFMMSLTSWLGIRNPNIGAIPVLSASGPTKASYHVVVPLIVPRGLNAALARDLKARFPQVDDGIYSRGHSLRLPLCVKLRLPGQIDDRRFLVGTSTETSGHFSELVASNLVGPHGEQLPVHMGLYDLPPQTNPGPVQTALATLAPHVEEGADIPAYVLASIAERFAATPADFRVSYYSRASGALAYRITPMGAARDVKCPLCVEYAHNSDSWSAAPTSKGWLINCFRFCVDKNGAGYTLPYAEQQPACPKFDEKMRVAIEAAKTSQLPPSAEGYIRYALQPGLNFVRASLGSGKTQQLVEILNVPDCPYQQVLMVSFRRTFAANMATRLGLDSYMDIAGRNIKLTEHRRLIIQVDSLHRLSFEQISGIDLLVLDEIESILDQLLSVSRKQRDVAELFTQILRRSSNILAMDGNLSDRTTELLSRLTGQTHFARTDYERLPHAGDTLHIDGFNDLSPKDDYHLACMVLHQATEGPIAVACCKVELARWLAQLAEARDMRVIIYTGRDLDVVGEAKHSMFVVKSEELPCINEIIAERQPHLFIYTTTITGGVSIDLPDYFTQAIFIYSRHILPTEFTQATARVRHLRNKRARLVIINRAVRHITDATMQDELSKLTLDPLSAPVGYELIASLAEREAQVLNDSWPLLIDLMRSQGFAIETEGLSMADFYALSSARFGLEYVRGFDGKIKWVEYHYAGRFSQMHAPITEEQWSRAELLRTSERKAKTDPEMPEGMEEAISRHALATAAGLDREDYNTIIRERPGAFEAMQTVKREVKTLHRVREMKSFGEKAAFLDALSDINNDETTCSVIEPIMGVADALKLADELGESVKHKQDAMQMAKKEANMVLRDEGSQKLMFGRDFQQVAVSLLKKIAGEGGTYVASSEQLQHALYDIGAGGKSSLAKRARRILSCEINEKEKMAGPPSIAVNLLVMAGFGVSRVDEKYSFTTLKK